MLGLHQWAIQENVPASGNWKHGGIGTVNTRHINIKNMHDQSHLVAGHDGSDIRKNSGTDAHPFATQAGDPLPTNLTTHY